MASPGWRLVQVSACAAIALDAVGIPVSLQGAGSAPATIAVGLALLGILLLRALVAYGAWHRARWAAWVGGILAVLSAAGPFVSVRGGSLEMVDNGLSLALGWAIAAAGAAFLVSLLIVKVRR
jgi:hypothetical protein